ncbi:olfactory receptor 10A7-like [Leptodactylus fuscus]
MDSARRLKLPRKENNKTEVTNFFLLGFQGSQDVRQFLFCLFLVLYCGTICGNLLIITLVSTSKILHTPMYFFISQLSTCDILLTISIVPNLLHILLNNGAMVTFIGCILQLYFFGTSDVFECFLLAVMSYDRYVAICNPLRYSSIMTNETCVILIVICWVAGFSIILIYIIATIKLDYCGPNIIDHVFCDIVPLLELACSDTFIIHLEMYLIGILTIFIPSTIIVVSYTSIIRAVLRIPSSTGRQKVFSTCSSHLIVVSIFFWTIFSVYIVPTKGQTSTMSKILSLLYTVFTSLVNPIIYSLRNKDIRKAIKETIDKHVIWGNQENNKTEVTEFFLLGFQGSQDVRYLLFCLFFVVYCGTICGNLLIITLVSTNKILQTPMYFFISQLSTCDILLTISIVPNLLCILLNNGGMQSSLEKGHQPETRSVKVDNKNRYFSNTSVEA